MMRVASNPFNTGIDTSMMMTSGFKESASRTASWPLSASPHSSHSGNECRIPCTPRRIAAWSSTISTRGTFPPYLFDGEGRPYACRRARSKLQIIEPQKNLGLYDLISHRIPDQLAHRMQLQFPHDVCAMRFRRLHADSQSHRYFLAALSLGKQLYNFALARRQSTP